MVDEAKPEDDPGGPRMSAEEAAAKADALIARYRAQKPGRPVAREGVRPSLSLGRLSPRVAILVAFLAGLFAGTQWRAHVAWAFVLGIPLVVFANALVRPARESNP